MMLENANMPLIRNIYIDNIASRSETRYRSDRSSRPPAPRTDEDFKNQNIRGVVERMSRNAWQRWLPLPTLSN